LDTIPTLPHTFIALSTTLTQTHLSQFPPTLTHLALIDVPELPIHLLPAQVPFIEVLDLSFNVWVEEGISDSNAMTDIVGPPPVLYGIEWQKWDRLRVFLLRGCGLGIIHVMYGTENVEENLRKLRRRVNTGRLVDVEFEFSPCYFVNRRGYQGGTF